MNPFASYRAINTKIHSKKRTLLPKNEWSRLSSAKNVPQVIDYLKKKEGYKELFANNKNSDLHRSELEIILDQYCVKEIEEMLHYFSGSYKEFFKTFLMEYEILDLDLILRTIAREESMVGIEKLFVHSEKWAQADYHKLTSSKNLSQFVEALKGSCYYGALKTMSEGDLVKREFHMEMKLYLLYYSLLNEKMQCLNKKDQVIARKYIGTKIDLLNAQWIYRANKYYDISPEEILIYSLPNGNKLTYSKLKQLSYISNIEECKKLIEKYLTYPLFKDNNDAFLDCMSDRYLYKFAQQMAKDDETIASSLAYISMIGIEMNDLIALTEGVRYALPENELSKYLVHSI